MPKRASFEGFPSATDIETTVIRNGEALSIDLPPAAVAVLGEVKLSFGDVTSSVVPAPQKIAKKLRDALPDHVVWRSEDDLLACLPEGAEPTAVARLLIYPGKELVQEDVRGLVWAHVMRGDTRAPPLEWLVVPRAHKVAAVAEWRKRRSAPDGAWPTADELRAAGVENVQTLTQNVGQILLLPPHALAIARNGETGRELLQWSRASAAIAEDDPCALLPSPVVEDSSGNVSVHALPESGSTFATDDAWRRLQRHPPVALAAFLTLCRQLQPPSPSAGTSPDAKQRKLLKSLIAPCRALLEMERIEGGKVCATHSLSLSLSLPLSHAMPDLCVVHTRSSAPVV